MAITFPSKTKKELSLLIDAFRVMAWQEYKATNKEQLKDLEYGGYAVFEAEWKAHNIHKLEYGKIVAIAQEHGYTVNEMLNARSQYYAQKRTYQEKTITTKYDEEVPY